MVRVAVAGGTGNVATEILRAAIASGRHDVTILTRSAPKELTRFASYKKVDYQDLASLTDSLRGFDVVLSFLVVHLDEGCVVQKNLIHACIAAGVRRFAPSEWGIKNGSGVPPYKNKDEIAGYLQQINKDKTVLEYTLFQPSIFLDYFAHPHPLSPNLITWPFFVDFEKRRAMILDDGDQPLVCTAIADISEVLLRALDDPETWPTVGGIRGTQTSINDLIALGKELRGGDWTIEHVSSSDIANGELKTSWVPQLSHPVIPDANREKFSKDFVIMFFEGISRGSWDVSDEFNKKYPDFEFRSARGYLTEAWKGREKE